MDHFGAVVCGRAWVDDSKRALPQEGLELVNGLLLCRQTHSPTHPCMTAARLCGTQHELDLCRGRRVLHNTHQDNREQRGSDSLEAGRGVFENKRNESSSTKVVDVRTVVSDHRQIFADQFKYYLMTECRPQRQGRAPSGSGLRTDDVHGLREDRRLCFAHPFSLPRANFRRKMLVDEIDRAVSFGCCCTHSRDSTFSVFS